MQMKMQMKMQRSLKLNIDLIEKKRISLGITKKELAKRCEISKQLLNFYYNNPYCINNMVHIANALKISWKNILVED